jgi:CheY-like chemotaxis protein
MRIKKSGDRKVAFPLRAQLRRRILIADDDSTLARAVSDFFTGKGFDCRITFTVGTARDVIEFWHPEVIFTDLMLPHTNAISLLKYVNSKPLLIKPRVIVMSRQSLAEGIEAVKRAGASGYLIKPFSFEDALRMVDPTLMPKVIVPPGPAPLPVAPDDPREMLDPTTKVLLKELHLVNLFLKQALDMRQPSNNLFNLMKMVSLKVKAVRCSFIRCLNEETGIVMASNDDASVSGLPIQLRNYPEIQEVRRTMQVLLIPNVRSSELMAPVREAMIKLKFDTIAVFPIFINGRFFGVTSLRMEQREPVDMFYIDHFGQLAAQVLSLTLANESEQRKAG